MTSTTNETSPNPRSDYGKEWLDTSLPDADRAGVAHDGHGRPWMIASPKQIRVGRAEMNREMAPRHEMMAREWSQKVSQYPRAVVGKFFTAHTAGFEEVGINGGQDRGVFTEREALSGATNSERLVKMFQGGQIERETANGEREVLRVQERLINFLIVEKRTKLGETMIDRLAFIQFQNGMYTEAGHRGHTPLKTTFYLPPEDTLQFLDDIRKNPDLIADVFDSAVAPAIPEPVYRMPAHYVGIVSQEALETAETAGGWKKQQFDALANSTEWRHYARPHGGETPRG